jgi:hypothetical protein
MLGYIKKQIMDRLTKQLVTDLFKSQEKEETELRDDFEYFCNYSVHSNAYNRTVETASITVGSGNDTGITDLVLIVNGQWGQRPIQKNAHFFSSSGIFKKRTWELN